MTMDWQQKLSALQAIADVSLRMRKPGDWYVSMRAEIKDGAVLRGSYGEGNTPEDAVLAHWEIFTTNLKPDQYVVVNAMNDEHRKNLRWNGFMWRDAL